MALESTQILQPSGRSITGPYPPSFFHFTSSPFPLQQLGWASRERSNTRRHQDTMQHKL